MVRAGGSSTENLRRQNLRAILRALHALGPTTRADLTRRLGLNRSTIGVLTTELHALGLVTEQSAVVAGRGRPSHLVVPCSENVVVAVDVGVDRIAVAMVGLGGTLLARRDRVHQRGRHDVAPVVEAVAQMVDDVLDQSGVGGSRRCYGVGVSVPGAIRAEDGMVRFAPNLGWQDEPFTALLAERLGRPVATGNDADLGVLAEHRRGAASGFSDVAYLSASVGIGGGFLVGGEPLRGAHGYAGEIGHLPLDPLGPRCRCGATGCWEMKVGENALLQRAGRLPGGGPSAIAEVIAAAANGEARARDAVDDVARWCGVGLRALVNLLNPEVVVLGGCLAQVWRAAERQVREEFERSDLVSLREGVLVRPASLGDDSSLLGAAELAFEPLLEHPQAASAAS